MGGIECYWWKFWRRLRALTEQLPRPVALTGGFEVATGGSALSVCQLQQVRALHFYFLFFLFAACWGRPRYPPSAG
jgi:hypothetical protein